MTTRLLSSLHRATLAAEHARNVNLATEDTETPANECDRENPTIGNEAFCRGIPLIGRGISGAIAGTDPATSSVERERGHRRGYADQLGRSS